MPHGVDPFTETRDGLELQTVSISWAQATGSRLWSRATTLSAPILMQFLRLVIDKFGRQAQTRAVQHQDVADVVCAEERHFLHTSVKEGGTKMQRSFSKKRCCTNRECAQKAELAVASA